MADVHPMGNTWTAKTCCRHPSGSKGKAFHSTEQLVFVNESHSPPEHQVLVNADRLKQTTVGSPTVQHVLPYNVSSTYVQTNELPAFKQLDLSVTQHHLLSRWFFLVWSLHNSGKVPRSTQGVDALFSKDQAKALASDSYSMAENPNWHKGKPVT